MPNGAKRKFRTLSAIRESYTSLQRNGFGFAFDAPHDNAQACVLQDAL